MIATAVLDLTENGRIAPPALMSAHEAENVAVRIYPPDSSTTDLPYEERLAGALAAIARCRLIAEGHSMRVTIQPAVAAVAFLDAHEFHLPAEGTEIVRYTGGPVHRTRQEAHRG